MIIGVKSDASPCQLKTHYAARVMRSCDASLFLCASCVRILPGFAAIYRAILLIFFVISGLRRTHNPLVGGSNPSGPTIKSIT